MPFFETLFGGIIENARRLVEHFYNPNVRISQSNAKKKSKYTKTKKKAKRRRGLTEEQKLELEKLNGVEQRLELVNRKMIKSGERRKDNAKKRSVDRKHLTKRKWNSKEIYFDPECEGRSVQIWTVDPRRELAYNERLDAKIRNVRYILKGLKSDIIENSAQVDVGSLTRLLDTCDAWSDVPSEAEDISMPPHKMLDVPQKMNYRLFFGYFMQTHGKSIATRVRRGQNAVIQDVKFEATHAQDGIGWYFNIYDNEKRVSTFSIHLPNERKDNRLHYYMIAPERRYHFYKRIKFRINKHGLVGAVVYSENEVPPVQGPRQRDDHTHAFNEILTECLLKINESPETRNDIISTEYRRDWIISDLRNTFAQYLKENGIQTMDNALKELELGQNYTRQIKYLCTGQVHDEELLILNQRLVQPFLLEDAGKKIYEDIFNRLKSSVAKKFNCSEKVAIYYMKQLSKELHQIKLNTAEQTHTCILSEELPGDSSGRKRGKKKGKKKGNGKQRALPPGAFWDQFSEMKIRMKKAKRESDESDV